MMKIDGRAIASKILSELTKKVAKLKEKSITPTMAIILMGKNEASAIYVKQKGIKAKEIGVDVKIYKTSEQTSYDKLKKLVKKLDKNPKIHGIIIQRPAPKNIDANALTELIRPVKEVDGFGISSLYPVPVAQAVVILLKFVHKQTKTGLNFKNWFKSKNTVVIGKGQTAGRPIIDRLKKEGASLTVIDSHTLNREGLIKKADVIVSAVGKTILSSRQIKRGVILIGVGLYTDKNGKLKGDYDDLDVAKKASYYSPTPGGVGPLNVACLLRNLIKAAENPIT